MTVYLEELQKQSEDFSQIRFCLAQLEQITIGEEILKMVEGVDINFAELPVQKKKTAHNHKISTEQIYAIDLEVKKGVIRKARNTSLQSLFDVRKISDGE